MKNKKKKFFRSPWLIGITATATGSIIAELFSKFKILTAIFNLFINIKNLIVKFFSISISIPLWIIVLLLIPIILIVLLIIILSTGKKESVPSFLNYDEDELFGIIWRWRWEYNRFSKKYNIKGLTPFCPKCDCQLTLTFGREGFQCPNGDFRIDEFPKSYEELHLIIRQRARKIMSENQDKG